MLRSACGIHKYLPISYTFTNGPLIQQGTRSVASGGFSDLWKAKNSAGNFFAEKRLHLLEVNSAERTKVP